MNRSETIPSPTDIPLAPLVRCGRCGRHGWHTTERCDEASPTWLLDEAVLRIDALRRDLDAILQNLPDDAPIWPVVDLTAAQDHLAAARILVDRCADGCENGR